MVKTIEPDDKATICFYLFCQEQAMSWKFKMCATNNLHKEFFCKVAWAIIAHAKIFGQTIIFIVFKVFSIVFSVFCFILFVKCFQGCAFSPGNLVKKNVFYIVTKGDLLIEKGNRFYKNQLPDVNLYLLFSLVYFQSLWKALLPI